MPHYLRLRQRWGHMLVSKKLVSATNYPSTKQKPPSLPCHDAASVDGKDPQRGEWGATKTEENVKVSSKVSVLKPKSGFWSLTYFPAALDTESYTFSRLPGPPSPGSPFTCLASPSFALFFKLGIPLSSGWASAQGGHTHSFLSILPTSSIQIKTSTYWNTLSKTHRHLEPPRPTLTQSLQISSTS